MRYLVDRQGRIMDDDYDGPAIKVIDGKRVAVESELDPASARIIRATGVGLPSELILDPRRAGVPEGRGHPVQAARVAFGLPCRDERLGAVRGQAALLRKPAEDGGSSGVVDAVGGRTSGHGRMVAGCPDGAPGVAVYLAA